MLGPPTRTLPATVWGTVHKPGTSIHSSTTAQTISVAPQMTSTSPVLSAPETIWSHMASTVPPARAASVPVTVPARAPMFTIRGIWAALAPMLASLATSHCPALSSEADIMATPESMAATPLRAKLATAWAGQYP